MAMPISLSSTEIMRAEEQQFLKSALPGLLFVAVIWLIHGLSWVTELDITFLGVYPRHLKGLPGILFSPFIHGNLLHLLSNSFPIVLLSALLFFSYRSIAWEVCIWILLTTNFWTYMLARQNYHIGASGIVYGLASFIFFSGFFRRDRNSIALSAVILVLYGGLVYGVLPLEPGVSWESHLFGAVAGLMVAWQFRHYERPAKKPTTTSFRHEDLASYSDPYAPWNLTRPEQWLDAETYRQALLEKEMLQQAEQQRALEQHQSQQPHQPPQSAGYAPYHNTSSSGTFRIVFKYDYLPRQAEQPRQESNEKE